MSIEESKDINYLTVDELQSSLIVQVQTQSERRRSSSQGYLWREGLGEEEVNPCSEAEEEDEADQHQIEQQLNVLSVKN